MACINDVLSHLEISLIRIVFGSLSNGTLSCAAVGCGFCQSRSGKVPGEGKDRFVQRIWRGEYFLTDSRSAMLVASVPLCCCPRHLDFPLMGKLLPSQSNI